MKNIGLQLALIVALIVGMIVLIYPPKEKLRLGKDLRGGVSLLYSVKIAEDSKRDAILTQVIDVLKARVNPNGVLDISFAPQGADRIEVVMPLPNPEVRQLQVDFRQALTDLVAASRVEKSDLEQAIAAGTAVEQFGGADQARRDRLAALQEDSKAATEGRRALEEAVRANDLSAQRAAEASIAAAEVKIEQGVAALLTNGVSELRVVRALALPQREQLVHDPVTGDPTKDSAGNFVMGASERDVELSAIRAEYPHLKPQIDSVVTRWVAYEKERTGLDDPEDLKRLFRGAGVLEFHITVDGRNPEGVNPEEMRKQLAERGPANTDSPVARWFQIQDLKQWANTPQQMAALRANPAAYFQNSRGLIAATYEGDVYILLYTTDPKSLTHSPGHDWQMKAAMKTTDELGLPAVRFDLDANGGVEMARLTGPNVGRPMAIVLDGQVYSAPNLQSRISDSGRITGKFSDDELKYLVRVLAAGSLSGQLSPEPISVSVLGPALGADNLQRGFKAVGYSVVAVGILMLGYYLMAGLVADLALGVVILMLFGVMAFMDSTFTMPGLAGIALAVGMAVDANVLINERMREELVLHGEPLRQASRIGFKRALSAILDGNLTNAISCIVLIVFAGTEVKGFGVTMLIGSIATLVGGLWVSRVLMAVYTDWFGARKIAMIGTVFPRFSNALVPKIDWIKIRPFLYGVSLVLAVVGVIFTIARGADLLDTEFRGGVALSISTRHVATVDYTVKAGDTAASIAASVPGGGVSTNALAALNPDRRMGNLKPGDVLHVPTGPCSSDGRMLFSRAEVEERVRQIGQHVNPSSPDAPVLEQFKTATALTVGDQTADLRASSFQIKVGNPTAANFPETQITPAAVKALSSAFSAEIDARSPRDFRGASDEKSTEHAFRLDKATIGESIGRPAINEPVGKLRNGVAIVLEDITPPITTEEVRERVARLRTQPDFTDTTGRTMRVIGLTPVDPSNPAKGFTSVAVLVQDPSLVDAPVATWDSRLAQREWQLISETLRQATQLDQVSSFSPSVARALLANAVVAMAISLILMLVYIWLRFSSFRFSLGTVLGLAFNLCICLGFLSMSRWVAATPMGEWIGIQDYRIDLNVVAGLLAIVGYNINDTIVVLDRVRERRGRMHYPTRTVVNDAINQTFTRTILTAGTIVLSAVILVVYGGESIRAFTSTILVGLIAGTFSSHAIAAPWVYSKRDEEVGAAAAPTVTSALAVAHPN